jgi:hypothetical protein
MDAAGLEYFRRDNCFTWLEHPEQAQHLMDRQLQTAWPEALSGIARSLNPQHDAMFQGFPMAYYRSTYKASGPPTSCFAARRRWTGCTPN